MDHDPADQPGAPPRPTTRPRAPMLNWAGNREYTTGSVEHPTSVEDVQRVVRTGGTLKALGTRHSFNAIGDTAGRLVATTTLEYYLSRAEEYIGSPMLSSMYGVWAAWTGGRDLAAKLFDAGYAQFTSDRFVQTLEYAPTRSRTSRPPVRSAAGELAAAAVVLPAGWKAIEVDRVWVRGRPARLIARHGDERARIEVDGHELSGDTGRGMHEGRDRA
jgi:hypothetical protein